MTMMFSPLAGTDCLQGSAGGKNRRWPEQLAVFPTGQPENVRTFSWHVDCFAFKIF